MIRQRTLLMLDDETQRYRDALDELADGLCEPYVASGSGNPRAARQAWAARDALVTALRAAGVEVADGAVGLDRYDPQRYHIDAGDGSEIVSIETGAGGWWKVCTWPIEDPASR